MLVLFAKYIQVKETPLQKLTSCPSISAFCIITANRSMDYKLNTNEFGFVILG